jgi:hypothetical protein
MSRIQLKKYVKSLKKAELEEQLMDLYDRFSQVKTYYDFGFNPREDKLVDECKQKIYKEYFPEGKRRPKARRSVAQKYIKHFQALGLDPVLLAEVMCFNLEIAQRFAAEKPPRQAAFYKSMHVSFNEFIAHCTYHGLLPEMRPRMVRLAETAVELGWHNADRFTASMANALKKAMP